jgi:hypothetical protein
MNNQELTSSELDCVFRTTEALRGYIMEVRSSKNANKVLLKALKHIEKADQILEEVESDNIEVMYGPPEVFFSPKELAEKRLRDEVIQQVLHTELTAEQWREIVADLVADESCNCRTIQNQINEESSEP